MFDLFKDIDKYKGIPPYASEYYGVYQPLLGWESKLTKNWVRRGGQLIDPWVKRVLDGRILPGPQDVQVNHLEFLAAPLQPGAGKSPFKVLLTKDLNSELLRLLQSKVQSFVDSNRGRLPENEEWNQLVEVNNLMNAQNGDLRKVNDIYGGRIHQDMMTQAKGHPITEEMLNTAKRKHLQLMQYESQIATFLLSYAEAQGGVDPNELKKLFAVQVAPPLADILRPTDPLANIDPADKSGALSPVGFVHLFRQYFFDLGTFLGEPVEHVWLAPGTTIELVEVSTRKTVVERSLESTLERVTRNEQSATLKDEISDAVKAENESSTKLGVSTTNTVNYKVYQGTVSANFGLESTRKDARETTHKQSREQSEKLSTEIKQSYKSVFKTVTETTDTRSRRYVLQNPTEKLLNYELRRKMRRVGVQVQDIGTRLCWQVFIDDPGLTLGLSELVHFAESPDLENLKEPEKIPAPVAITKKVIVPLAYKPVLDYTNNRAQYEFQGPAPNGVLLGVIKGDEDDDDSQIVMEFRGFKFDSPQTGYLMTKDIRLVSVQGNKQAVIREIIPNPATGTFDVIMQRMNFGGENVINLEMELIFEPGPDEVKRINDANAKADTKYAEEKQRLLKKSFMENVRERIKDASNIRERPAWDLREEERTIVYRKLIERLMLDTWDVAKKRPDDTENRRLSHVRSEIVRTIFDVDSMLYFVAPEWWMPRRRRGELNTNVNVAGSTFALTEDDLVRWGGEKRDDNYKITEDSAPAKLGSSLGWLMQLDGDNLRNAFLNAPWVKAVIPIRPGREKAALNWLREVAEGKEGLNADYLGTDAEDAEFQGLEVGEVLEIVADRLEKQNGNIKNVLEADKVFEKGFDHLAGGFDAGLPANQVFSQWISVLPTDQIVAVEYKPTNFLTDV